MVTCSNGHPSPPVASPVRPVSTSEGPGRRLAAPAYPPPPGQPWVSRSSVQSRRLTARAAVWLPLPIHPLRGNRGSRSLWSPGVEASMSLRDIRPPPTTATGASVGHPLPSLSPGVVASGPPSPEPALRDIRPPPTTAAGASVGPRDCPLHISIKGGVAP